MKNGKDYETFFQKEIKHILFGQNILAVSSQLNLRFGAGIIKIGKLWKENVLLSYGRWTLKAIQLRSRKCTAKQKKINKWVETEVAFCDWTVGNWLNEMGFPQRETKWKQVQTSKQKQKTKLVIMVRNRGKRESYLSS